MKKLMIGFCLAVMVLTPALAGNNDTLNGSVYVVHGINGTDLGLPMELPVDIEVLGLGCVATGFSFKSVTPEPFSLPAAKYDIEVRLSDGNCTGPLATSTSIDLAVLENATVIAHLNEEGSPTLTKYTNDVRETSRNKSRVYVRHTAAAPPVSVRIYRGYYPMVNWDLDNPGDRGREFNGGDYYVRVVDDSRGLWGPSLATIPLELPRNTAVFVHAVGSLKNGTFDVLPLAIPLD